MTNESERKSANVTRRQMLMRLGLAAGAIYAAPVLLQLSEARASGPSGSWSGPSGRRRRHPAYNRRRVTSFSDGRKRRRVRVQGRPRVRRMASSFSR